MTEPKNENNEVVIQEQNGLFNYPNKLPDNLTEKDVAYLQNKIDSGKSTECPKPRKIRASIEIFIKKHTDIEAERFFLLMSLSAMILFSFTLAFSSKEITVGNATLLNIRPDSQRKSDRLTQNFRLSNRLNCLHGFVLILFGTHWFALSHVRSGYLYHSRLRICIFPEKTNDRGLMSIVKGTLNTELTNDITVEDHIELLTYKREFNDIKIILIAIPYSIFLMFLAHTISTASGIQNGSLILLLQLAAWTYIAISGWLKIMKNQKAFEKEMSEAVYGKLDPQYERLSMEVIQNTEGYFKKLHTNKLEQEQA
ncbi:hypothetical protein L1887_49562 [Cichorium endivia]|nr:hypothetical protein L1887_49562 [Cichorium endivia]